MPDLENDWIWCLVANVTREPHLECGEMRLGTKHFAPGAKLYCFPYHWSDGGERLNVLGRHRRGGPWLIDTVIATKLMTNWRVRRVFQPFVIQAMAGHWDGTDESRQKAVGMAEIYNEK